MAVQDIVDRLVEDHEEFRRLFAEFETLPVDQRADYFRHLVSGLARHEASEEAVVHSAVRDLPGGETVFAEIVAEESEAERLLAAMEKMDPASAEFEAAFLRLRKDVLEHAAHEERDEFPRLRQYLDADRRQALGTAFGNLKRIAPTHPHPRTPQSPAVRALVGPIAGIFDRARDAARNAFSSD